MYSGLHLQTTPDPPTLPLQPPAKHPVCLASELASLNQGSYCGTEEYLTVADHDTPRCESVDAAVGRVRTSGSVRIRTKKSTSQNSKAIGT